MTVTKLSVSASQTCLCYILVQPAGYCVDSGNTDTYRVFFVSHPLAVFSVPGVRTSLFSNNIGKSALQPATNAL